jgi:alkylation response protein AidB-like acyl-CoA dehydrogenase
VKLRYDVEVEAFRAELLEWLAANRPSPEEMAADPSVSTGHAPGWARRWTRAMFDAGWLVPGWPPERGGRNAGPIESLVFIEELAKAKVPRTTNVQGLGIVAPSIFDYGSEAQVRDYALPILRGEVTACLGMSEPGAGSDLASLSTRAVRDGLQWVLNGQKVWTSGANYADFCFLFCRTDAEAPKHKGISIVLVPMDTPGVTVRPLPELIHPEHPDLNEVFLDDVRVPLANLVGAENDGWAMANGSLAHERGMVWVGAVMGLEESLERLLGEAPPLLARLTPTERALAADQIVQVAIDTQAARCLGYRGFAKLARGGNAPEQALMKLYASEARQHLALIAAELQGADALETGVVALDGHLAIDEPQGTWLEQYFISFANTISAGASEIQRNIIAERVLGLPRG